MAKKKRRIEKIQKHKGYWKLIRAFREIYGEAKDEWECKYRIQQFRGAMKDDLQEIKSMIRSKKQDFHLGVKKYDSSQDYDFYTSDLIEELQFIQKLEGLVDLLESSKNIYREFEEEFKLEIPVKAHFTVAAIQYELDCESDRLWNEGYRVTEQFLITPNGKNRIYFYDEIGWSHNKGATAIEITYR